MGNDVFIVGAGFSCAIDERMPTLAALSSAVYASLGDLWDLSWGPDLQRNVELLLTHLASDHPWEGESEHHYGLGRFFDIQSVLIHHVQRAENELLANVERPPDWLIELVRSWHDDQSTVITFNYDTLVERAFRQAVKTDGGGPLGSHRLLYAAPVTPAALRVSGIYGEQRHETFRLLKLHGSLNWWYSGPESPPGDIVYDTLIAHWGPSEIETPRAVHDRVQLVVPPTLAKGPYYGNSTLRAQWRLAKDALAHADRIFCVGFSLPASDLQARLLLSTLELPPPIEVVDLSEDVCRHYRDLLPGKDVRRGTFGPNAVADFVADYT